MGVFGSLMSPPSEDVWKFAKATFGAQYAGIDLGSKILMCAECLDISHMVA